MVVWGDYLGKKENPLIAKKHQEVITKLREVLANELKPILNDYLTHMPSDNAVGIKIDPEMTELVKNCDERITVVLANTYPSLFKKNDTTEVASILKQTFDHIFYLQELSIFHLSDEQRKTKTGERLNKFYTKHEGLLGEALEVAVKYSSDPAAKIIKRKPHATNPIWDGQHIGGSTGKPKDPKSR
jgi:hypothetical protein